MYKFNLQMFAEEEEFFIDDEDLDLDEGIEELEDEDLEDLEDEIDLEDLEDEEPEAPGQPLDKKTKAIIRHKKENQELRQRLQELEQREQEVELEKQNALRVKELQGTGLSLEDAKIKADNETENLKLRNKITYMELEQLETSYPGITRYSSQIAKDKENLPEFSYEQIYLAKYYKQSKYDTKTKLEQQQLHQNRGKKLGASNVKGTKAVKLDPSDERIYRIMKQSNPRLTRKEFQKLLTTSIEQED